MTITCGIDWAEQRHDVAVLDHDGRVLARRRIDVGVAGFTELVGLLNDLAGGPSGLDGRSVPIAIETDKNLLVVALQSAGFTVYPINPLAVARYRDRHGQAGKKSDADDARVLADILRTDAHRHRALPEVSEHGREVKALARQHQEAVWAMQQTANRLRSILLDFYPQALLAFPNLLHKAAQAVLTAAPTPAHGARLTSRRVVTLLHRCGRRNDAALVEHIVGALTAPALRQPVAVEAALGVSARTLLTVLGAQQAAVETLEEALSERFAAHPLAPILRSAPGLGPVLAARVLAEIGDDPARFESPSGLRAFAGTAPVTRASGRSHYVKARKIRNKRLGDACHWWAFAMLTKSSGARAHYDRRRAAGDHHNAALRNLANKLLGRLWWCLKTNTLWDESTAWSAPTRQAAQAAA
jgi:transposase